MRSNSVRALALALLVTAAAAAGCAGEQRVGDLPDEVIDGNEGDGPTPTAPGPTPHATPTATPHGDGGAPSVRGAWPIGMGDLRGSRAALEQDALTAQNAAEMGLAWAFETVGSATGTPTVRDGVVYAATWKGMVYAIDADTGEEVWRHESDAQVDAPVTVWEDLVLFGDAKGQLIALDAATGDEAWRVVLDETTSTHVYATVVVHEGIAFVGVASDQESVRIHGDQPVDFRGSVVALDARSGEERWRAVLVPEGYTGAPVWGTPVVADELGLLIFGTGNAYTAPAHNMTDAIVALRLDDGSVAWSFQATENDVFTQANPISPDWDFGSTPSLFAGGDGRLLVGLGQKSSRFWALDAATGEVVWKNGKHEGGQGIIGGSAYADGLVLVPHTTQKRLAAIHTASGEEAWSHAMDAMVFSAPAIVPGAVFVADSAGTIRALALDTGELLWNASAGGAGGVFGGLSVADGTLFVPTVEAGFLGETGYILAFRPGAEGTSGDGGVTTRPPGEVRLVNVAFQPDTITIAPGSKVTWVNGDAIFHTATSGWDSGETFDFSLQPDDRAEWTFDEPGTYQIYCKPHASPENGGWVGMTMTVVVEEGGPD